MQDKVKENQRQYLIKVILKDLPTTVPAFAREVIEGIHIIPKVKVLEDLNNLLKHPALTSKSP